MSLGHGVGNQCTHNIEPVGADNDPVSMGTLNPSLMTLSGVIKITPRFHGHLKASLILKPLSGVIEITLPIETPVIHVPQSGRVGGALPHKSYNSLS